MKVHKTLAAALALLAAAIVTNDARAASVNAIEARALPAKPAFRFKTVIAPGAITFTGILGINNLGDIVGVRDGLNLHAHGFLKRAGGRFVTIDFPGATDTNASGINDDGVIVGTYFDHAGFQHGFMLRAGQFTTLDVPGAAQLTDVAFEYGFGLGTAAFRINNEGTVVGQYADAQGYSHGFEYHDGSYRTVDVPAASHGLGLGTQPLGIGNNGVITGGYFTDAPTPAHCFIVDGEQITTLDFPGAAGFFGTQCNGSNTHGVIVGPWSDAKDRLHGFVWRAGLFTRIDFPFARESEADGINDLGVIIGQYTNLLGLTHGYIATAR